MPVDLGSAFAPKEDKSADAAVVEALEANRQALLALGQAPKERNLTSDDYVDAVNAVIGLRPNATADEMARAITREVDPMKAVADAGGQTAIMARLAETLEKLDYRMQGMSRQQAFGASGPSNISDNPNRQVGIVSSITEPVVFSSTDLASLVAATEFSEFTAIAPGTRTATFSTDPLTNPRHRGVRLYLNVSAASGTLPTLDIKLQSRDHLSGAWADIANAAFPQVSAAGTWVLVVYPGINQTTVGQVVRVSNVMSPTWRLVSTIGGTGPSFTYSVGGVYLP